MLLTKVTLNNFGVYRGRNEFDFKTSPEKPIILCGGKNGAGKTTLFESVMLCLYGLESFEKKISQKQYHEIILRTIHRYLGTKKSADEALIVVEFQFAQEGEIFEYQVMRMWQNNNGKIDEKFSVQKKKISEKNFAKLDSIEESEWQTYIDQLLPIGITKLFFFDGEKIQSIADGGDEDRHIRTSFDALLGLDLVKQLSADIGLSILRNSDGETKKILDEINLQTKEKEELEKKLENIQDKQIHIKKEITNLQRISLIQEEKFKKLGGQFANKREQLAIEKATQDLKLNNIKREIRELCSSILPFSLVPKQLEFFKDEIKSDQQKIKASFEKNILEKNFTELLDKIKSKSFLSMYDDEVKQNFTAQMEELIKNKIESLSNVKNTKYNFSANYMTKTIQLLDGINNSSEKKMESLAKSFNTVKNSLQQIKVGLSSAPNDDEIGPVFSELNKTNRELGELENEFENLKTIEAQEKTLIVLKNTKIRNNLTKRNSDKRRISGGEMGRNVQDVLEDYTKLLRGKKIELLERYILDGLKMLLHKKDFIEKVSIDHETFEVRLYKGNDDEITKNMLSKGELQMYATAVVWGLAKTSGRPLPFMIDTPLARLDEEHRKNIVENFFPNASHQTIILSTDSEINYNHYQELKPYISKSFVLHYDFDKGKTIKHDNYFFDEEGGKRIIEV